MGLSRRVLLFTGTGASLALVVLYAVDPFGAPRYRGAHSPHFNGRTFENLEPIPQRGFLAFLRWKLTSRGSPWPDRIESGPGPPPAPSIEHLRVTVVNHATVLIQTAGINILTDPVWSDRVGPVSWAGPRRRTPPGVRYEDLPPIHAVLISHNHYDHLDVPTLQRLARDHRPRFVVSLGNGALLAAHGIAGAAELDWWQSVELTGAVRVTSVPAQHFSARGLRDRNATLWCGYVIESKAGRTYFAGDTGWGRHFEQIRERFAPIRLALLPIGAYRPRWFMSPVHISPAEALRAHEVLGASASIAIHYGTFRIADDGPFEGIQELQQALEEAGGARFWVVPFGDPRDIPGEGAAGGTQNTEHRIQNGRG